MQPPRKKRRSRNCGFGFRIAAIPNSLNPTIGLEAQGSGPKTLSGLRGFGSATSDRLSKPKFLRLISHATQMLHSS